MSQPRSALSVRADWLAARAMLAARRLRPFWFVAAVAFGVVFVAMYAARGPLAERTAAAQRKVERSHVPERDTAPLLARRRQADSLLAARDSAWRAAQYQSERAAAAAVLSVGKRHARDSLRIVSTELAAALDRAAKAPLPSSYLALADTRALRQIGAVQVLIDTLALLERTRQALDPVEAPQSEFAQLSRRANALGSRLQAIGQSRLSAITRQMAVIEAPAATESTLTTDTAVLRAQRDSAKLEITTTDSALREARQWFAVVQARTDSVAHARADQILGASPTITAVSALLMLLVLGFTVAVIREARMPTLAHAREAERLTGVPVLGVAAEFRVPREGRARLQSGVGVDPFRMLYLALTASGSKERVVCMTGDDVTTVVAAACRLAVCAAADERATLLVDLAPGVPGASAFFEWRNEPGFTEAIVGVSLWREVARPIGASEGLSLEVIPAGSRRQDTTTSVHDDSARAEFARFLAEYDVIVLVAPNAAAVDFAAAVIEQPATVLTARIARTRLQQLRDDVARLKTSRARLHGILVLSDK